MIIHREEKEMHQMKADIKEAKLLTSSLQHHSFGLHPSHPQGVHLNPLAAYSLRMDPTPHHQPFFHPHLPTVV